MNKPHYKYAEDAAYMAKHFDVGFVDEDNRRIRINPIQLSKFGRSVWSFEGCNGWFDYAAEDLPANFYINPDSSEIFEPVEDDLVFLYITKRYSLWLDDIVPLVEFIPMGKIIQRNGLSFIWPKEMTDIKQGRLI